MKHSFAWIFVLLALQRLFELHLSRKNRRSLEALGGREFYPETFRNVVAVHSLFLASLLLESYPWRIPIDALTLFSLAALALLSGLRYWCMAALGPFWNVRIVAVPGAAIVRSGPYGYLRHPNYLAVALEFIFLPLLMRAPVTLAVFSLAGLLVLRQRIRLEERALREITDYDSALPTRLPDRMGG